ncbi:hypothetical protein SAMN05421811_102471 [Nonomuraea wenchangensis]|uniref:HIRAN domain-containing protein n=1 Tax=Nonomuraea wenchangensis TaxID=568860 RepID=A0A1I0CWR9_9ACTN|nr:hypothetical protein SAMN05421811_102471 [Nonomuraea wenchangensis]
MASSAQSSPSCTHEAVSSPRLVVAQQDPVSREIMPVGILESADGGFTFSYFRRVMDIGGFRPIFGFEDLERRYTSSTLFPMFSQRLMNPKRPDYDSYLTVLGLSKGAPPLRVLGRSGGRRAGDSIFLVPEPHVAADGSTSTDFFVHGVRYKSGAEERIAALVEDDELALRPEPANPVNPRALLVTRDGGELGYVPNLLLDYVHQVRDAGAMTLRVAQVNGSDTPLNLRMRVRLEGRVPSRYAPFRGEEWATFS